MKPPATVYVGALTNGDPIAVYASKQHAAQEGWHTFLHRYRLDTPKRKVPPSRLNVAGGVVRKKRKGKRGRKS